MAENNKLTGRLSRRRTSWTDEFVKNFDEIFADTGIDVETVTAIIFGGIYYVLLRRERSPFFRVDFSTEEGRERITEAAAKMISTLFQASGDAASARADL